ncbi:MAG: amino acid ABC transporter substrate-binding protein [Devosia sp.]
MKGFVAVLCGASLLAGASVVPAFAGEILDEIKDRGVLRCGVYQNVPALATLDDEGNWQGFDVDYCKAVAAALFGSGDAVEYVPMNFAQGIPAVKTREVDMAGLAMTYVISRDGELGLDFVGPTLFSGHGFMVHKRAGAEKIADLDGASICVVAGTLTDSLISDYFSARGMSYTPVAFENSNQRYEYYENGRCDVVTSEIPFLGTRRIRMQNPDDHVILDEVFAKSHMGPIILEADPQWSNVARWVHYALIQAEEFGINQDNIDEMLETEDPEIQRFLGVTETIGEKMGVSNDFVVNIIRAVGNYDDVWERNFGMKSAVELPRGLNALAQDGGMQWAPNWR